LTLSRKWLKNLSDFLSCHQTRILCQKYGVEKEKAVRIWGQEKVPDPGKSFYLQSLLN